jgi:hypothetical protein
VRWVILKIFSRTTTPESLVFTQKHSYMVQIQVCTNHGPQGLDEATMGKTIFTCVDIGELYLKSFSRTTEPARKAQIYMKAF